MIGIYSTVCTFVKVCFCGGVHWFIIKSHVFVVFFSRTSGKGDIIITETDETLTEVGMKRSQNGSQRGRPVNRTASNSTDLNGAPTLQKRRRRTGGRSTGEEPLHRRLQKRCRHAKRRRQAFGKNQVGWCGNVIGGQKFRWHTLKRYTDTFVFWSQNKRFFFFWRREFSYIFYN